MTNEFLRTELLWALKQLEYYLPQRLDTEASKVYDRMRGNVEFIDSNPKENG